MKVRLLIGRSGSGKTARILREIGECAARGQGRQLLIVPELFSHQYERRLAETSDNHAGRTAEVLSFTRLAQRVFAETGGLADRSLSAAGRLLTLYEALHRVDAGLSVYHGLADRPAMVREVLSVLDELQSCRVAPEEMFAAADQLDDREINAFLKNKLTDLSQIYTAYDRLCSESLPDPRSALDRLADALPDSALLRGTTLYIDAFASFTAQEFCVVEEFLRAGAESLTVALTCALDQPNVFYSACNTVKKLRRACEKASVPCEIIDLGGSVQPRPHDLAVLEQYGLLPCGSAARDEAGNPIPDEREIFASDGRSVSLVRAASPLDECTHAAAWIRRTVRETGAHWRDFAVVMRSSGSYPAALEMAMRYFEVPIYLSARSDLLSKPPIALVTGALAAVRGGFRAEDVFGCLKTGLCALTPDEIDRLENYAFIWQIRGSAWERDWTGHPEGYGLQFAAADRETLAQLNEIRARAIAPFAKLKAGLHEAKTAGDCARALYGFLEDCRTAERIEERAAAHEAAGRLQLADEYRQLWEILVGALEETVWVCGEQPMEAGRFTELLPLVLSEYDVGTIPVSLDRVTCGEIGRVCARPYRYVILLGCNDGMLPKAPAPGTVLTEADRLALEQLDITLQAFGAERMMMEQETIYKALACPTEQLVLSCHTAQADGRDARASYLIDQFKKRLCGLPDRDADPGADCLEAQLPRQELACTADGSAAARAALREERDNPAVARARAVRISRGPLENRTTIDGLFGREVRLTASRADLYQACPFAYFMQYGLKAKPRRLAGMAAPETGTFIHFVLETVLRDLPEEIKRQQLDDPFDEHAARVLMRRAIETYVTDNLGGLEDKTPRFRYLFDRLCRVMETILRSVLAELRESEFKPIDFELDFSREGDLPPVTVTDGETTVSLRGKVDRVDGYIRGGKLHLRVMDYKSGKKAFSLSDIWYGLNMQLIIYLFALKQSGLERYRERLSETLNEIVPAGVLYVPARDALPGTARAVTDEEIDAMREKELRRSGLLTDEISVLEAMETGLHGDGKYIPVSLQFKKPTKKEPHPEPTLGKRSSVADLEQFGRLARLTTRRLLEIGQELRRGAVEASPCVHGNTLHCDWCPYRPACRFDESAGDRERQLYKLSDEEVWEKLKRMEEETDG